MNKLKFMSKLFVVISMFAVKTIGSESREAENTNNIMSQQELLDYYNSEKKLHEGEAPIKKEEDVLAKKEYEELLEKKIIEKYLLAEELKKQQETDRQNQAAIIELERREREERERQERERDNKSILEDRGQQIGKEANRVVNQTTNEVKRFVRKF